MKWKSFRLEFTLMLIYYTSFFFNYRSVVRRNLLFSELIWRFWSGPIFLARGCFYTTCDNRIKNRIIYTADPIRQYPLWLCASAAKLWTCMICNVRLSGNIERVILGVKSDVRDIFLSAVGIRPPFQLEITLIMAFGKFLLFFHCFFISVLKRPLFVYVSES